MSSEKPPTFTPARPSVTGGRPTPAPPPAPAGGPPRPANGAAPGPVGGPRPGGPRPRPFPVTSEVAPAAEAAEQPVVVAGPRKVRMSLTKVDPWSVMKLSFLLSVAAGIMLVVASAAIWHALNAAAVFTQINDTIAVLAGRDDFFDLLEYVAFDRVISLATMIGVADIVILTALATLGAFLYNIVAALVGGVYVTLTDE